jgi:hypothetical protein
MKCGLVLFVLLHKNATIGNKPFRYWPNYSIANQSGPDLNRALSSMTHDLSNKKAEII